MFDNSTIRSATYDKRYGNANETRKKESISSTNVGV